MYLKGMRIGGTVGDPLTQTPWSTMCSQEKLRHKNNTPETPKGLVINKRSLSFWPFLAGLLLPGPPRYVT